MEGGAILAAQDIQMLVKSQTINESSCKSTQITVLTLSHNISFFKYHKYIPIFSLYFDAIISYIPIFLEA